MYRFVILYLVAAISHSHTLSIHTCTAGTGTRQVQEGDRISVHYSGSLKKNGEKDLLKPFFDSSYERRTPFSFTVGKKQVITGWEKGVIGMRVGEKRFLAIPPELGYGSRAIGPIPSNSWLYFIVELVAIN